MGDGGDQQRLVALDGLRGIAVIAVFLYHTPDPFFYKAHGSYLAVDLFFMLSGFVLAHGYGDKLQSGMTAREFMLRRYLRLAPVFWLALALSLMQAIQGLRSGAWPVEGVAINTALQLLFLPVAPIWNGYNEGLLFPHNGPAWSLFLEIMANIVFAVVLGRGRVGIYVLAAVGAVALVASAFAFGDLGAGFRYDNFSGGVARVVFSFFAGVLLYWAWKRQGRHLSLPLPLLAAALIGIFSIPSINGSRIVIDLAAAMIVFPLLIWFGAEAKGGRLTGLCVTFGALSYPLYATHVPMIWLAERLLRWAFGMPPENLGLVGTAILFVVCVGFALALDRWIDRPVRKWAQRQFGNVKRREAVNVVSP